MRTALCTSFSERREQPYAEDQGCGVGVPGQQAGRGYRCLQTAEESRKQRRVPAPSEAGYEVFAVNPNVDEVEGDRCYHDLRSIPGGVDAVVIATKPERAEDTMRECADLGIKHVWMHRGPGARSVSEGRLITAGSVASR
jgi:CoA binding domain